VIFQVRPQLAIVFLLEVRDLDPASGSYGVPWLNPAILGLHGDAVGEIDPRTVTQTTRAAAKPATATPS
jgi:hypothetical protein